MHNTKSKYSKLNKTYTRGVAPHAPPAQTKRKSKESFSMNPYMIEFKDNFPFQRLNANAEFGNLEAEVEHGYNKQVNSGNY
jgi:hypothetical protein